MPHNVSLRAALLLILAATACGGSKNNGTASSGTAGTSGGSGATSSTGSGGGSATGSGTLPAPADGGCSLGAQAIDYAGCTECAVCWQTYCCQQSNDCLNDPACNALLACQSSCYNGTGPDGGVVDVDASTELPDGGELDDPDYCAYTTCLPEDAGALYNGLQDCLNTLNTNCTTACTCP
jgi:hypothetical protein